MSTMIRRVLITFALTIALVAGLAAGISLSVAFSAQAAGDNGGVTNYFLSTLANGNTAYSFADGASYITSSVSVPNFGAVDVQMTVDVTGSQVVTFVPQFSLASTATACGSVPNTEWFTATTQIPSIDYAVTITTANGAAQIMTATNHLALVDLAYGFSTSGGDGVLGREVPAYGRCFRAKLYSSAVGLYTPTIYLRYVNRTQ